MLILGYQQVINLAKKNLNYRKIAANESANN